MRMIEIKLAPEEQTNTSYASKDRRVSLYISVAFILSLFLNLSISVTICLPLISVLTHSPYPFLRNNGDKKWPALSSPTFSLTFPPFSFFSSPSSSLLFSPSPSLQRAWGMCQSSTKEQKLDGRRRRRRKRRRGGGGERKLREVKERQKGKRGNGGKEWAERERLRGAEHGWVDVNAERCFVITCWHAASRTFQSSLSSPLWTARTQDGWGRRCATPHGCLFDSGGFDAFLVVSW